MHRCARGTERYTDVHDPLKRLIAVPVQPPLEPVSALIKAVHTAIVYQKLYFHPGQAGSARPAEAITTSELLLP